MRFKPGITASFLRCLITLVNKISSLFGIIVSPTMYTIGRVRERWVYNYDYFRFSSLELVAHELNERYAEIGGCVAELGVWKGEFAQFINRLFPDRTLYLFDTFDGFDRRNFSSENESSLVDADFSDTSVEIVLKKMKYREKCIVRKGFFPETAFGLEAEEYIFVSIDADLYEPIYEGLKYFYPRLIKGGYIFIHDYNNRACFDGVQKAVKLFCEENDAQIIPLSDYIGSAVLVK